MREAVKRELAKWFSRAERVVLVGIGNPIRMDDYVGIIVIRRLHNRVSEKVLLLECETVPENYIQQIVEFKPTHILLIDAALLGLRPGEEELLEPKNIGLSSALLTHALPLKIFCEYLAKMTNAKILLLLIQPKKTDFGEGLTQEVLLSAIEIVDFLSKILPR